jgi:hypothetical protein
MSAWSEYGKSGWKQMKTTIVNIILVVATCFSVKQALTNNEIIAEFQAMRNGQASVITVETEAHSKVAAWG